jgi:polyhydroxybutyrate depolymerase
VTPDNIDVGGFTRSFILATRGTDGETSASRALVLALHGDGQGGSTMQALLRFEDVSGKDTIVAYPTGADETWDLYDPSSQNPDEAFIVALIDSLRARFSIDAAHVFAIGMSSGAFMINQLACRHSSLFRGMVAHSGGAPSEPHGPSAGTWGNGYVRCVGQATGPAVMVIHGTADTTVPLASGADDAGYWATVDGCGTTRSSSTPPPCLRQDNCPTGRPVFFCPIEKLGHELWTSAATAAWGFFQPLL